MRYINCSLARALLIYFLLTCVFRFEIPEHFLYLDIEIEEEDSDNLQVREDLKRFRKEYVKPVQFR